MYVRSPERRKVLEQKSHTMVPTKWVNEFSLQWKTDPYESVCVLSIFRSSEKQTVRGCEVEQRIEAKGAGKYWETYTLFEQSTLQSKWTCSTMNTTVCTVRRYDQMDRQLLLGSKIPGTSIHPCSLSDKSNHTRPKDSFQNYISIVSFSPYRRTDVRARRDPTLRTLSDIQFSYNEHQT